MCPEAQPNVKVNKEAKAGTLRLAELGDKGGDKSLLDSFSKLTTGPLDDDAAAAMGRSGRRKWSESATNSV